MPRAISLSYDDDAPEETGDAEELNPFDETGGFLDNLMDGGAQALSSLLGGKGGGIGESIGSLAGTGIGMLAGGAGAGIAGNLGKMAGGAVENLIRRPPKKKKPAPAPKKPAPTKRVRQPSPHERKVLAAAQEKTRRTGEPGHLKEARLRVYKPIEYKRQRDAGLLWSQLLPPLEELPSEAAPLEPEEMVEESPYLNVPDEPYDDTSAPDPRPRPLRHISAVPFTSAQLDALVRNVPLLRMLDQRMLRMMSGSVGVARDVSGVDPTTGTYHAMPGETPHGITKKLTGQVDRTQELFAANPGKAETATVWNIPPGWLQYAKETGATFTTARKYIVLQNDWPEKIAKKLGACPSRVKWWAELKAANPHKAMQAGTGNWASLFAGEEIGIPNEWPETSFAVPIAPTPSQSDPPGLPAPGKTTTLDPAVTPQVQALLAEWALRNPSDCKPSDYGRNPLDLVSGFSARAQQALASFQTWWNKKQPTRALPTSGELDKSSYDALVETHNVSMPSMPLPTDNQGGQQQTPQPTPQTQQPQTQQPQQQPQQQPTTNTTSNAQANSGAPDGWPSQWPWPPLAEPPAGWPSNWQWPPSLANTSSTTTNTSSGSSTPDYEKPAPLPAGDPPLDSKIPAEEQAQLREFISLCQDPEQLEFVAAEYEATGYPIAAQAMRDKAAALRAGAPDPPPPVIWGYDPSPTPTTDTGSKNSSLLPVIAVLGVGLAFST